MSKLNSQITMFLFAVLLWINPSTAQISPGDLAKVHAHLEGMSNCTQCHNLGDKVSNDKCLTCHKEIKVRIDANKGYHVSPEVKGKSCASCHNDHHGRNFQIIRFKTENFNHKLTGYALEGAHAQKKCNDCHKPAFISDPKLRKKPMSYLGLKTECLSCHEDYHQSTLSVVCSDCHDQKSFKPAPNFSHLNSNFPLKGKHKEVLCIDCHKKVTSNGRITQQFKGIKYNNCTDCHLDPHENRFGQNCSQCHNEQSFLTLNEGKSFDHNLTKFKLKGRHQKVTCKSCHKKEYTASLAFSRCTDCHTDYHNGQFSTNNPASDCADCHSENGFTTSTFSVARHNESGFKLKGAHVATPCIACHQKTTTWNFRNIGKQCIDCHNDIHQNKISPKYYPGQTCESCHLEDKWASITFDHSITNFALEGAHKTQGCRSCHFPNEPTGHTNQRFSGLTSQCATCHNDIHGGQFDKNNTTDCGRCHNTNTFISADKFNHDNTLFPLDGRHRTLACTSCHKSRQDKQNTFIWYKIEKFKCEDCH